MAFDPQHPAARLELEQLRARQKELDLLRGAHFALQHQWPWQQSHFLGSHPNLEGKSQKIKSDLAMNGSFSLLLRLEDCVIQS